MDSDSIPAIGIVAIVGSRWDRWRSLANQKFGFHMIVTIAEQFTSDPSDRERSPALVQVGTRLKGQYIALSQLVYKMYNE